jgi:hypothetical protein
MYIIKVAIRSPTHIYDLAVESAVYYPLHECTYSRSLLSIFMKKIVRVHCHLEYGILNLQYASQFTIHVHDKR